MRKIISLLISLILNSASGFSNPQDSLPNHDANKIIIPIGGNSWVNTEDSISNEGLTRWFDPNTICRTYLRISVPGKLKVSLLLNACGGKSRIKVKIGNKSSEIEVNGNTEKEFYAGEWTIEKPGYWAIEIQGLQKSEKNFGTLSNLVVSGSAITSDIAYVKDNNDNYFYWGRRGPSVHLKYNTQGIENIAWFYNEITVPANNDVLGSYFMANGFNEGYFGMQVNSETERRILFSVWSPYQTDDPTNILEGDKIKLVKKGENTYTGEFGNEGSGGQSYMKYNWKAGNTYKFLLHGNPLEGNRTEFTAYFFAPEVNKWILIASFIRPKTFTYLTNLHSFLENFIPETGNTERMALYGNQWVADTSGKWTPLNQALFTGDNTARINFRKDYAGGELNGKFFLKNCGFFNDFVMLNQQFTRIQSDVKPNINFAEFND